MKILNMLKKNKCEETRDKTAIIREAINNLDHLRVLTHYIPLIIPEYSVLLHEAKNQEIKDYFINLINFEFNNNKNKDYFINLINLGFNNNKNNDDGKYAEITSALCILKNTIADDNLEALQILTNYIPISIYNYGLLLEETKKYKTNKNINKIRDYLLTLISSNSNEV